MFCVARQIPLWWNRFEYFFTYSDGPNLLQVCVFGPRENSSYLTVSYEALGGLFICSSFSASLPHFPFCRNSPWSDNVCFVCVNVAKSWIFVWNVFTIITFELTYILSKQLLIWRGPFCLRRWCKLGSSGFVPSSGNATCVPQTEEIQGRWRRKQPLINYLTFVKKIYT